MRVVEAPAYPRGQTLACPVCGQRAIATGRELAVMCHNRHRATLMRPVDDANSTSSQR